MLEAGSEHVLGQTIELQVQADDGGVLERLRKNIEILSQTCADQFDVFERWHLGNDLTDDRIRLLLLHIRSIYLKSLDTVQKIVAAIILKMLDLFKKHLHHQIALLKRNQTQAFQIFELCLEQHFRKELFYVMSQRAAAADPGLGGELDVSELECFQPMAKLVVFLQSFANLRGYPGV